MQPATYLMEEMLLFSFELFSHFSRWYWSNSPPHHHTYLILIWSIFHYYHYSQCNPTLWLLVVATIFSLRWFTRISQNTQTTSLISAVLCLPPYMATKHQISIAIYSYLLYETIFQVNLLLCTLRIFLPPLPSSPPLLHFQTTPIITTINSQHTYSTLL